MKRLPSTAALKHSLKSTLRNLPFAFHASWPWLLIMLPLQLAAAFYIKNQLPVLDESAPDPKIAMQILSLRMPLGVLSLVAVSSIAVSWHRFVLMDEVPTGWNRLRVDAIVLRYIGNSLLIAALVAGVFFLPAVFVVAMGDLTQGLGYVLALPLVAAALVLATRLNLKLPAIALDRTDFSLRDALRLTRDNNGPILAFVSMAFSLVVAAGYLTLSLADIFAFSLGNLGLALAIILHFGVNWLATVFLITIFTSLYGFFVEDRAF
jgi:hypothetical protein